MRKHIFILCMLVIVGCLPLASLGSAQTTLMLSPSDDSMIKQDNPNAQSGNSWDMMVRNGYGDLGQNFYEIDSFIKFDIFSIPASATILSATIHLYYYNWSGTNPAGRNLTMYFVTSSWTEYFINWKTQPTYRLIPSNSVLVPSSKGEWITWDVTNDVQYLVEARVNYGWKITDEDSWKQSNIPMVYFRTKEFAQYTPFLEVTYTISDAKTPPLPGFFLTPVNPSTKDSLQFRDTSYDPDGTISEWLWNFGDGNTSNSSSPAHSYNQEGQYTVTLKVTDNDGMTAATTTVVTIGAGKSAPGFELLFVGVALAVAFFVTYRAKRRQ